MYRKILVTLENTHYDEVILRHIEPLAKTFESELLLVHVADGWVARNFETLKLAESEEIKSDRAYLESVKRQMEERGITTGAKLLMGEPADEIIKLAEAEGVDLIAMTTHGHRFLSDLIYGSVSEKVRHRVEIPVLLLKAPASVSA